MQRTYREEATMDWGLMGMWHSMSGIARGVVILLLCMSARSVMVMINRGLRFSVARNQSRAFIQQVADAMRDGNLDEVISVAERNRKSPIASIVATGVSEFQSALPSVSNDKAIDLARRGLDRSVATTHSELKRGLSGLATIGATAPFVGLFGTVLGITHAFRGSAVQHADALSGVAAGIAEALVTTALGLLVAVPAVWCYNYFTDKMELFDLDMANSSMELVSYLATRPVRRDAR
jgi:biopolymer transport protein ExbB/biopolymer transport protein TolQ